MADGNAPSSFPPNSNNDPSENNHLRFSTFTGNSSITGSKRSYLASQSTSADNDVPVMPAPSSAGLPLTFLDGNPSTSKKLRGRPRGSKNKPKPPVIIKETTNPSMEMVFLEIPTGKDIAEILINYAQRHQAGILVMNGSGYISDVTLLHQVVPFEGPFHMISLSGTYFNPNCHNVPPRFLAEPACSAFSICLSDGRGQVFGGVIGGSVYAVGVVCITAALLRKPMFHRIISINGSFLDIEEGGPMFATNESNNNNIVGHVPNFNDVNPNSSHGNHHLPPRHHGPNANAMQWGHSSVRDNY